MRVRPRLLRRLRTPRASLSRSPETAAPHVRLLTERLLPDDAWIHDLTDDRPGARAPLAGLDDVDHVHSGDGAASGVTETGDAHAARSDGGAVIVELRRERNGAGDATASTALETAPFDGEPVTAVDVLEQSGARNLPARSLERLVYEVALRNEIVAHRVERIERRLDELADQVFEAATQCDLIEVEARRARLAAEVTRLSVELRAEIDSGLSRLARELAELVAERGEVDAAPLPPISPLVSLSDLAELGTLPGDVLGRPGPFAASG